MPGRGPQVCRREVLRAAALGLAGAAVGEPLAAIGAPQRSAKAVIVLWLWGGPSHLDTFDPKPDAPLEYRGPFEPIATSVPGVRVCELLPGLARAPTSSR